MNAFEEVIDRWFEPIRDEFTDRVLAAKKICFFAYNFCVNEPPYADLNEIFSNPHTQCGGFVHVFRRLAAHFDIATINAWLFNIPNEGNHSIVHVCLPDGRELLFDPTFGTFFTPHGDVHEQPYSLADLYFRLDEKSLVNHVVQARKLDPGEIVRPLEELFTKQSFSADYMELDSYLKAEAHGISVHGAVSVLCMTVDMSSGAFSFGGSSASIAEGENMFLEVTNDTLNDPAKRDVSFNMSFLGSNGENIFRNMYRFIALRPGAYYELKFHGFGLQSCALRTCFPGRVVAPADLRPVPVPEGSFEAQLFFRAKACDAEMLVETVSTKRASCGSVRGSMSPMIRIFGIECRELPGIPDSVEQDEKPTCSSGSLIARVSGQQRIQEKPFLEVFYLAAGSSSRLGTLTADTHKCLLPIGHKSMIEHFLDALSACHGVYPRVHIVVGHHGDMIKKAVGDCYRNMPVVYHDNPLFAVTGAAHSLWLAREALRDATLSLVVEGDHFMHPELLKKLIDCKHDNCVLVDTGANLQFGEETIVVGREGIVEMLAWDSSGNLDGLRADRDRSELQGEAVFVIKLDKKASESLAEELDRYLLEVGSPRKEIPEPLNRVFRHFQTHYISTDTLPWTEIDFPDDLERARSILYPAIFPDGH